MPMIRKHGICVFLQTNSLFSVIAFRDVDRFTQQVTDLHAVHFLVAAMISVRNDRYIGSVFIEAKAKDAEI